MRIAKKTPNKTISLILYFACFSLIIGLFFFSWTPALSMAPESELSISGGSINEIDGSIAFTITRTNTPDVVTVTVQSADGTAEAGTDYVAFPATDIIFAGGGGVQTEIITVTVNDDINIELEAIIVDGYVSLGQQAKPGLGMHLYNALTQAVPVIGVAKNKFAGTPESCEVLRGRSQKPLFVTAVGMPLETAKLSVESMHGDNRIPTVLKRVDQLCRGIL